MPKKLEKSQIVDTLSQILMTSNEKNARPLGTIKSVMINPDNNVGFAIEIDPDKLPKKKAESLRLKCEKAISVISGVNKVTAVLTADTPQAKEENSMENIKNIILVASGKGGVGKSTVATNLATSLAEHGYSTGILDADILGPSQAKMLGIGDKKPETKNGLIIPLEKHGVKCLSTGMLVGEDSPIVWRGPMISKAIGQLTFGAEWGELDYLIVDMPPGTGDIQITISKHYPITGAIIVSTPQEVALMDVKKAIGMFKKMTIPIIGIVENMSYFVEQSGDKSYIFGKGNIEKLSKDYGLEILCEIPLTPDIAANSDQGTTSHQARKVFSKLVEKIIK